MATKRAPKRAYSDNYLKFGFTSIVTEGIEKPQCVICLKVLSAESMKPFQLKRHFEKEHPTYNDRDVPSSKDNLNLSINLDLILQDRQLSL